jgi:hypothetical protein
MSHCRLKSAMKLPKMNSIITMWRCQCVLFFVFALRVPQTKASMNGQLSPPGLLGAPLWVAVAPRSTTKPGLLQILNESDAVDNLRSMSRGRAKCGFLNRSAGITITLGERLAAVMLEDLSRLAELQGRAGALRVKMQFPDLLPIAGYAPLPVGAAKERQRTMQSVCGPDCGKAHAREIAGFKERNNSSHAAFVQGERAAAREERLITEKQAKSDRGLEEGTDENAKGSESNGGLVPCSRFPSVSQKQLLGARFGVLSAAALYGMVRRRSWREPDHIIDEILPCGVCPVPETEGK